MSRDSVRRAGAYRLGAVVLLHPVAHTRAGIGVLVPPVHRFTLEAEPASIGATLRGLLASPPTIVPPDGWKERADLGARFLKAAGVRSWRQLQTGTVSCWIEASNGGVTLTPLCNGGTRGDKKGFQPFGAALVALAEDASDAELGAAVIETLNRSR
jgi:hypothetical protein